MKTIIIYLILTINLSAQILISEVLFNEPGNRVNLEWIELYNSEDTSISLNQYYLVAVNDTCLFPTGTYLQAHTYLILARHLISNDSSDSFERYWGDSSGVWGAPIEDFPAIQADFQLPNNSGLIQLYENSGHRLSYCSWDSPTKDGFSLELDDVQAVNSGWHECTSIAGSTPGRTNSIRAEVIIKSEFSVNPRIISIGNNGHPGIFTIDYSIALGTNISIKIHDDSGRRVRSLVDDFSGQVGRIEWDGRDNYNKYLRPGVYIIILELSGDAGNKYIPVVIAP